MLFLQEIVKCLLFYYFFIHVLHQALVSGSAEVQNYQTLNDTDTSSLAPAGYGDTSPEDESAERVEASEPSIQDPANGTNKESNILGKGQRSPIVSVFVYIMKQSYICTLIVMMVRKLILLICLT